MSLMISDVIAWAVSRWPGADTDAEETAQKAAYDLLKTLNHNDARWHVGPHVTDDTRAMIVAAALNDILKLGLTAFGTGWTELTDKCKELGILRTC